MNGSRVRYSSSSLLKKAHTCRVSLSWEPAREIGVELLFMVLLSRPANGVSNHDKLSQRTLILIYFEARVCLGDCTLILRYCQYHRPVASGIHTGQSRSVPRI